MQATGIVRNMDELGRLVIPVELRRHLDLEDGAALQIFTDNNEIILRKYAPFCIFCGEARDLVSYEGVNMCLACVKTIAKRYG